MEFDLLLLQDRKHFVDPGDDLIYRLRLLKRIESHYVQVSSFLIVEDFHS